jgi:hypothetical protein
MSWNQQNQQTKHTTNFREIAWRRQPAGGSGGLHTWCAPGARSCRSTCAGHFDGLVVGGVNQHCRLKATAGVGVTWLRRWRMSHRGDKGKFACAFAAYTAQKLPDNGYYLPVTQMNDSDVLAQVAFGRGRAARLIVPMLLGAVILTDATQVCGHVRTESGSSLVLTGVIAYTDPRQGFAIIGSNPRNTYLARPGQQLPDGSRIREIHPKNVVLESGGSLQTVGLYERERTPGAAYVQIPAPGQPARWEEPEPTGMPARQGIPSQGIPIQGIPIQGIPGQGIPGQGIPGQGIPGQARPTDLPPGHPRPSDLRPNETPANEMRLNDGSSNNELPRRAQPDLPLPTAQDPVDDFNDYRRQRIDALRQ